MSRQKTHKDVDRSQSWTYQARGHAKPRRIDRQSWRTAEERARVVETAKDTVARAVASGWIKGRVFERHAREIVARAMERGWARMDVDTSPTSAT